MLALSGGGSHGAFSAGVINGWTASGKRPTLDIVSGVSTGALIATYAFVGPEYDCYLREFYTTTTKRDIYRMRSKPAVLWSKSAASSQTATKVDRTDDHTAVAQCGHPGSRSGPAALHWNDKPRYRSAGDLGHGGRGVGRSRRWTYAVSQDHTGVGLGARFLSARGDRSRYQRPQIHGTACDGGTTAQVFFRASMLDLDRSQIDSGHKPLAGSRVYIIVAGKVFPDPKCVNENALKIASSALSALTYAQTRNDLGAHFHVDDDYGMDFRLAAIPQEMPFDPDSLSFDPAEMNRLYQCGFRLAKSSQAWANVPPVFDASQQSVPRSGTHFLAPNEFEMSSAQDR